MDHTMRIYRAERVDAALVDAVERLLPQLSERAGRCGRERLEQVVGSTHAALFVAEIDGRACGMLTLGWYPTPTGVRAWIEDVVVDTALRGCGAGATLVRAAVEQARRIGAASLMLHSSPQRAAAHRLYAAEGFEQVASTLFRWKESN